MAQINLRDALMAGKRLPYDAEVEYLESTGTQWIDTGKYPTYNTGISTTVLFDSSYANSYYIIFEARRAYLVDDFGILNFVGSDNQLQFRYGGNRYMSQPKLATDTVYEIRTEGRTLFVDGTPKIVAGSSTFSAPVTLKLFALDTNGTISPLSGVRIFRFAIYESGTPVRDFIPVRKGTVGYLYDRVSGALFGNAGTGDFVLGSDVVPVEYIESHGTEYIDTGVVPSGQTKWELDVMFPDVNGFRPMGAIATNPTRRFVIARELGSTVYSISFGSYDNTQNGIDSGIRRLCVIDAPNFTWSIGARSGTFTEGTFDISGIGSICLFVRKRNSGYDYLNDGSRVYRSTLYTSGSRIQDLRSVRVGTEGAMMDVLTRRIYRNAGTGAFGYGNDLKYPIPSE